MVNGAIGLITFNALWRVGMEIKPGQGIVPIQVLLMVDVSVKVIPCKQPFAENITTVQVRVYKFYK